MDFTLLKSFIAVAEEKSFSSAAKNLFISQQTLSKQVAKLEEDLGTTLFIRSRPLGLTPDGGRLLPIAKEILMLKQQFEESSSKSFSGAHYIHLGIEHTIARAILPRVLPEFLREHPDTYIKLSEESPDDSAARNSCWWCRRISWPRSRERGSMNWWRNSHRAPT